MAGKKDNIKALFTNTRSRVIIFFTVFLMIFAISFGIYKLISGSHSSSLDSAASLSQGPVNLQSIPGAVNQTAEYAHLQETQNEQQAIEAQKKGKSAIPTIIRSQEFGSGATPIIPAAANPGLGFAGLTVADSAGDQKNLWLQALKDANCSAQVVKKVMAQGATLKDVHAACSCIQLKANQYPLKELQSVCSCKELKATGFNARDLKEAGFTAAQLKTCGFSACELKGAGFTAKELQEAGFTDGELKGAGFSDEEINKVGALPPTVNKLDLQKAQCNVDELKKLRASGVSAASIHQTNGCSAAQLRAAGYTAAELKAAGFSARELKDAGFSPKELKDAGFSAKELKEAGFSAKDLKDAGFSAKELKDAGFSAKDLKDAGFSAKDLKDAGFSAKDLKDAGFSAADLQSAGFSAAELKAAGYKEDEMNLSGLAEPKPGIPGASRIESEAEQNTRQLQAILNRQQANLADQRTQQELQQHISMMVTKANTLIQGWKEAPQQTYIAAQEAEDKGKKAAGPVAEANEEGKVAGEATQETTVSDANRPSVIKTGDVIFAVLDTSVNSDEPSPILATIVSGKLKGAKLIGSFNLPGNSDKLIINFNSMSVPGVNSTISIRAYAIDPNTARTALATMSNHHYLQRYGSLFAATFLEGFGNAFQSANTTITIGGTGGVTNTTVQSGVGRSLLENSVIGLATLGKSWGQVAQQQVNRPPTVEICAGTGVGVLFTQDISTF